MAVEQSIPAGWEQLTLSAAVQPRREKALPADHPNEPFIGMDHVESKTMCIIGSSPASTLKSSAARFYANDILYGRLRPYLNKVAQPSFQGLASAEFIVFPETPILKSQYLKYRLNASDFVSFASHLNEGDRPRVNFDQIGLFPILLPPLNEQTRIVQKIEELFSELDKGVESLKTAQQQLKVYRQALLKQAFEGKLTAQWRADNPDKLESAEQLLERIKTEQNYSHLSDITQWKVAVDQWMANGEHGKKPPKPRKIPTIKKENEGKHLSNIPSEWNSFLLKDIVTSIGQGWSPKCENTRVAGNEWAVIKTTAIQHMDYLPDENKRLPSDLSPRPWLEIKTGDFLITRAGPRSRVGVVCRVVATPKQLMLCDKAYRLRFPSEEISEAFMESYLNSTEFSKKIESLKTGISDSGVNITQPGLLGICIPMPHIDEQKEIAKVLSARLSIVDKIEADLQTNLKKSEALRQSILKKAFAGQLVAQDPDDEPASELLARIRQERDAAEAVKAAEKAASKPKARRSRKTGTAVTQQQNLI